MDREWITTRCPACGCQTLFIGSGGHLTCSWLRCPNPSVADMLELLKANTAVLKHLKATLDSAQVRGDG